ncbi:hypothetical protein Thein_0527 [Thermodesulfatator indicus DSM 15286]|uniref:FlgO domain-containing protein n=1 Tax=Thermodesulfatator indicus (strain DSM 15286 / JCM 11887 / CIR29812) TaxID=667014 RepID=F8AB39_THEID|nr:hypothetical protein Thein_0527 [Thermodesulfatator indicus DSM 15286]
MKRILCFFIWLFLLVNPVLAEQIKIAILPFKINAKEDLSYVREGIKDMLSTRLCDPPKVMVIDENEVDKVLAKEKEPFNTEVAKKIGEKLKVDYVVLGSVSFFGQKVSIDAEIISVKENKPPLVLSTYVTALDDIIPKLDEFARKGLAYVEGEPLASLRQLGTPTTNSSAPALSQKNEGQAFLQEPSKVHPERIYKNNIQEASPREKAQISEVPSNETFPPEILNPPVAPPPQPEKKKSFWSKLLPWNWFGKDKEEVAAPPKGSVSLPPPPPPQSQAPQSPSSPPGKEGETVKPQPSGEQGKTWEWY